MITQIIHPPKKAEKPKSLPAFQTVGELIKALQQQDPNSPVVICGYESEFSYNFAPIQKEIRTEDLGKNMEYDEECRAFVPTESDDHKTVVLMPTHDV